MIPSLAVIISTYNNPDFLRLVLHGYARQSDLNFHVYIADDGSGETTRELIEQITPTFPVPIQHIWHKDDGFRKSRIHNLTLQQVKEPYVLLTDGDCIPHPHLIQSHRRLAQANTLLCGSRILLSQGYTQHLCQTKQTPSFSIPNYVNQRIKGNINRIFPLIMPPHLSSPNQKLSGIHGCHISCHTKDLFNINGFDESFEGWGREDSDLVARLFHNGIQRRNLRGTPVLHLWHQENSRARLNDNDALLQACLTEKRQQAIKGIAQLDASKHDN